MGSVVGKECGSENKRGIMGSVVGKGWGSENKMGIYGKCIVGKGWV